MQHGFIARGMQPDIALKSAYKALDYAVTSQANVLSYMDVFYYLGIIFLACIPFVLFVKRRTQKVDLSEAMH
jgi:MFS transporter, DHA2 family, multidrug resistance protein